MGVLWVLPLWLDAVLEQVVGGARLQLAWGLDVVVQAAGRGGEERQRAAGTTPMSVAALALQSGQTRLLLLYGLHASQELAAGGEPDCHACGHYGVLQADRTDVPAAANQKS